jgi:hypothetical protein
VQYSTVATGKGNDGFLQVVLLGKNDSLPYLIYQTNSGAWYAKGKLPNPAGVKFRAIATGRGNGDNSLQVLLLGANDSLLYLIYQTPSGNWLWAGRPGPFGTMKFTAIAAGVGANKYLQVVGIAASDSLPYLIYQGSSGTWYWGGHLSAFGTTKFRSVVTAGGGGDLFYLQVLGLALNDLPYQIAWQDLNPGGWHSGGLLNQSNGGAGVGFRSLSPASGDFFPPEAVLVGPQAGDGSLYAFGSSGAVLGGNPWYGHLACCNRFRAVAAGVGNQEQIQVISLGQSNGLPYLTWMENSQDWHYAGELPNAGIPFSTLATGNGNMGSLQVILLGENGLPYLIYQTPGGAWYWGGQLPNP